MCPIEKIARVRGVCKNCLNFVKFPNKEPNNAFDGICSKLPDDKNKVNIDYLCNCNGGRGYLSKDDYELSR